MADIEKLLRALRSRPASVRWEELEAVIEASGGRLRANANRTHYVVLLPGCTPLTVARPHGKRSERHVRPVYVRRVLELIGEARAGFD